MSGTSWVTDVKKILTGLAWLLWVAVVLAAAFVLFGCQQAAVSQPTPVVKAEKFIVPMRVACGEKSVIVAALKDNFDERRIGFGISPSGILVEIYASFEGKTFTVVASRPDGHTCLLGYGFDWQVEALGSPI